VDFTGASLAAAKVRPMTLPPLLRHPQFVQFGIRVDTAPSWWWLNAQLAAAGAICIRAAQGVPVVAALGIAACVLWPLRARLRTAPRLDWLAGALGCTVLCALESLPAAGLMASGAAALAFLPVRSPTLPPGSPGQRLFENTFVNRVLHKTLFAMSMLSCIAASLVAALWRVAAG
jgi:hypothetical protein